MTYLPRLAALSLLSLTLHSPVAAPTAYDLERVAVHRQRAHPLDELVGGVRLGTVGGYENVLEQGCLL